MNREIELTIEILEEALEVLKKLNKKLEEDQYLVLGDFLNRKGLNYNKGQKGRIGFKLRKTARREGIELKSNSKQTLYPVSFLERNL